MVILCPNHEEAQGAVVTSSLQGVSLSHNTQFATGLVIRLAHEMDSPRSSEESLTHRRGDLRRRSLEEIHPNDDEDYAGGEDDGIQLGLLSRKSRLGKEREVLGLDGDGLTTRQLVMGILAEVGMPN